MTKPETIAAGLREIRDEVKKDLGGEGPNYRGMIKVATAFLNVTATNAGKGTMDMATLLAEDMAEQGREEDGRYLLAAAVEIAEARH